MVSAQQPCINVEVDEGCECINSPSHIFNLLFRTNGSIVFLSHMRWLRDADRGITLCPDSKVLLTNYGYAVEYFYGKYVITDDGIVRFSLENYPYTALPDMVMMVCGKQVFLRARNWKAANYMEKDDFTAEDEKDFSTFKMVKPCGMS